MEPRFALLRNSFIDYPGRIACVVFVPGCDFRCPYCHNKGLLSKPRDDAEGSGFVPLSEVVAFLASRKGLIEAVVLSGGEPLLTPETADIAARAKSLGYLVKLDTNGSNPGLIPGIRADYIALDVKTLPANYSRVCPNSKAGELMLESMSVIRNSGSAFEWRITCAHETVSPEDMDGIAGLFLPGETVWLQNARTRETLLPVTPWEAEDVSRAVSTLCALGIVAGNR